MILKIKICGLREAENVNDISALNPDFMGFIFYPPSKRFVGEAFDGEILKKIPEHIAKVGVFVNESLEKVKYLCQKFGLDFVQLHGNEHPEYCQKLKENNIKIIKAFSVQADFDAGICKAYESCCSYFLFDTSCKSFGGSGQKFDWNQIQDWKLKRPFFLSGGIGPDDAENIKSIEAEGLYGIDINSKFELKPGLKDVAAIKSFLQKIRS